MKHRRKNIQGKRTLLCVIISTICSLTSPIPVSPLLTVEDKLHQLQELVKKGETRGVFTDRMPAAIHRSVSI